MTDTEWTSPGKMMDYYMPQIGFEEMEKELYLAVVNRQVRVRLNGRGLGPEWLKQLSHLKGERPFALPPDLELSIEDAKRKWGT